MQQEPKLNTNVNKDQEDKEIIKRVLSGEINCFEQIIDRYQNYTFKIVSNSLPANKVEEVCHEIFIRVYKSLSSFRGESSFKSWFTRIVSRSCVDYWRKNSKILELPLSDLENNESESEGDSAFNSLEFEASKEAHFKKLEREELADLLKRAMENIAPEDKIVLTLTHLEGYSIEECANFLGWQPSKVKVRAHRARHKLREILSSQVEANRR
ncbi:MAG: RNA polymerase sigma factor [Candidatus Caenarcaniphilales bacterium]|nr:RNA polymerase sigma factor [Candidatus Caenarcaniphilales bacterium]